MIKTIMVTGASGFLGQEILRCLYGKKEYQLVAVTSGRREVNFPENVQVEKANLLEACERADLIKKVRPNIMIHLAWEQGISEYRNADSNMHWLEASIGLLREFNSYGGELFFFAGSSTEYETDNGKFSETKKLMPSSLYGRCKRIFSLALKEYSAYTKMRYIDALFFTVYGENDSHLFGAIPSTITQLLQDKPVICKSPNNIRDYIYISDAAKASIMALESGYSGSINISSGRPHRMKDVFNLIARELGKEDLLSFENETECELVSVGDNSILKDKVGFNQFVDFEDTMKRIIAYRRSNSPKDI